MRLKLIPLALLLATSPMLAHAENLLDAYRQAYANDPTLAQSQAQRLVTAEGVPQARSTLLPQLNASLSLQQRQGSSGTIDTTTGGVTVPTSLGHARTRNIGVTLTQTILDFSKYANLAAAHSQADSQDAQYQAAVQDLMIRVSQAYFNILTAQDAVAYNKAYEQSLARELDQANQRFKVGLSAITDVQDAKAQHDSATAQLITARNQLDDFREALSQITGQPVGTLEVLRDKLPMDPPQPNDQATWVKQALDDNPSVLAQRYNVDAAEHNISAARAGRLPTIDASVNYGKSASWYQNGSVPEAFRRDGGSTTIGVTLNVPIFSGGFTQSRVRQSIYQRDGAQDSLEITRRQIIRNTRNYFRSVLAGISEVEATKAAVTSSGSALKATQAGFEVGTRNIVDVLNSQVELTNARQQYSQARHQFILNKLLLRQASGTITVDDLKLVNALLEPPSQAPVPAGESLTPNSGATAPMTKGAG